MLTFEVVGFRGAYHAILGRLCYAKFMAVPNYTYLKMKMLGPKGVISVGSSIEHAFDCDVECVEHVEVLCSNHSEREATWEKESALREKYPHLFEAEVTS
jgi:hypothetical protein